MQTVQSIIRALYRIVFRGGTPQRIQFSTPLMLRAVAIAIATTLLSGRFFFDLSFIELGLVLFTLLSGLYIGAALLTRSVPRAKLRASLLTILLLLGLAGAVPVVLIPARQLNLPVELLASTLVFLGLISGTTNTVHYAMGGSRAKAAFLSLSFAVGLGAFYATLRWLLETVFS